MTKVSLVDCYPIGLMYTGKGISDIRLYNNEYMFNKLRQDHLFTFELASNGFISYEDDKWIVSNLYNIVGVYYCQFIGGVQIYTRHVSNIIFSNCVRS